MKAQTFSAGDVVRHRLGGVYEIVGRCTFENTLEDCYAYRGEDGHVWVRPTWQMEDGRFVMVRKAEE